MKKLPNLTFCLLLLALLAASPAVLAEGAAQKVIKDPKEYDAYMTALALSDPAKKAAGMEAFVAQFPQSIMRTDALGQAMAAYQQAGDVANVEKIARRIFGEQPGNIQALAVITYFDRGRLTSATQAAGLLDEAARGLSALSSWTKPDGVSDQAFQELRRQMTSLFSGAAGFASLQKKDYAAARSYYRTALGADPTSLQDTYQLSVAELEASPLEVAGFWHGARAVVLARAQGNAAGAQGILQYVQARYRKYHGGDDGWDSLLSATAGQVAVPDGFTVKPAPTPAELAVQAVEQNSLEALSFSDKEFILSYRDASPANQVAAEKVWASFQAGGALLKIPGKVVACTAAVVDVAVTEENQTRGVADLRAHLANPLAKPLTVGADVSLTGEMDSYTPKPILLHMKKAVVEEAPVSDGNTREAKKGAGR